MKVKNSKISSVLRDFHKNNTKICNTQTNSNGDTIYYGSTEVCDIDFEWKDISQETIVVITNPNYVAHFEIVEDKNDNIISVKLISEEELKNVVWEAAKNGRN